MRRPFQKQNESRLLDWTIVSKCYQIKRKEKLSNNPKMLNFYTTESVLNQFDLLYQNFYIVLCFQ
jgi:hypothetical protein